MELNYTEGSNFDNSLEYETADELENGISNLCLRRLAAPLTDDQMAELCVDIVQKWVTSFSHLKIDGNNVQVVDGIEASEIDKTYIETQYWLELLQAQDAPHKVLNDLFEGNGYRDVAIDVASHIPDDPVQRFVFHFIYGWAKKFKMLFQDEEVCEGKQIAVLKKQVENIVYYGRRRLQGSTWRMYSLPDDILRQALIGQGATVNITDSARTPLETIQGQRITASADPNIRMDAADGPKTDELDKLLYKCVVKHAKSKELQNLNNWTMVRASFDYKRDDGTKIDIRCYAFSGINSEKTSLPLEWWNNSPDAKKLRDFFFGIDMEILLAKGSEQRLGQNMVMSIFNALHTFYEEDLRKLTEFIAFEDVSLAQALIMDNRNDLVTLDYGKYYDEVITKVNKCNESILKTIAKVPDRVSDQGTIDFSVQVTCGWRNKQYKPDINGLKGEIYNQVHVYLKKVEKISRDKLSTLEHDLKGLPTQHLDQIRRVLVRAHCGEDNVLPLLLAEMLKRVKVFLATRVTFIALDANHLNGKPFCHTCGKKVRFFSILPSVLRFLGATGIEEDTYLEKLFASLQN